MKPSQIKRWLKSLDFGSTEKNLSRKAVLQGLILHANKRLEAWPTIATLAEIVGGTPSTISRALEDLLRIGAIAKVGKKGVVTRFRLLPPDSLTVPEPSRHSAEGNHSQCAGNSVTVRGPWEDANEDARERSHGKGRVPQVPNPERETGGIASEPRDPASPASGIEESDWRSACELADLLERGGLPGDVTDRGGRRRALALCAFAEQWPQRPFCRDREDPWRDIRPAIEWAVNHPAKAIRALEGLRKFPDGAYPAAAAGSPSRLERLIRDQRESRPFAGSFDAATRLLVTGPSCAGREGRAAHRPES